MTTAADEVERRPHYAVHHAALRTRGASTADEVEVVLRRDYDSLRQQLEDTKDDLLRRHNDAVDRALRIGELEKQLERARAAGNAEIKCRDDVMDQRDALLLAMDPRRWNRSLSDAWHRNIPDMMKAFHALRDAALSQEGTKESVVLHTPGESPLVVPASCVTVHESEGP